MTLTQKRGTCLDHSHNYAESHLSSYCLYVHMLRFRNDYGINTCMDRLPAKPPYKWHEPLERVERLTQSISVCKNRLERS